jgi:peroxiredoxin
VFAQLARYRDLVPQLIGMRAQLVTISTDMVWSHAAFADAHRLPFLLLADDRPRGNTARAYGVYDVQRQAAKRALFVMDAMGTITRSAVFLDVVDPGADGILIALEGLNRPPPTEGSPA